jgi:hypothetical protein
MSNPTTVDGAPRRMIALLFFFFAGVVLISFDGDQDTLHIPHTRTERTNREPDYVSSTPIRRTERLWVRIGL